MSQPPATMEHCILIESACRLPGSIDSAPKLWDLLVRKGSVQTPQVPSNRFNIDAHFHEDLERPGSFNVAGGYFLDGSPDDFDPTFFNITPIEAMWMDPQQRRMLEVCYECLESGGGAVPGRCCGDQHSCFRWVFHERLPADVHPRFRFST